MLTFWYGAGPAVPGQAPEADPWPEAEPAWGAAAAPVLPLLLPLREAARAAGHAILEVLQAASDPPPPAAAPAEPVAPPPPPVPPRALVLPGLEGLVEPGMPRGRRRR